MKRLILLIPFLASICLLLLTNNPVQAGSVAIGSVCTDATSCVSGAYCDLSENPAHTCKTLKAENQECFNPYECVSGTCTTNKCTVTTNQPAAATTKTIKAPKLAALSGVCQLTDVTGKVGEEVSIPWIAQCLTGLYGYSLVIGAMFAVMFIIIGGVMFTLSGFNKNYATKGKEMMFGSVFGLVVLVSAFLILNITSPQLTSLSGTVIQTLEPTEIEILFDNEGSAGNVSDTSVAYTGPVPAGGIAGNWYKIMTSADTCGDKLNGDLPMSQRQDALAKIIKTWAALGSTQGGAVYVHGGDLGCNSSGSNETFLIRQLVIPVIKGIAPPSPNFLSSPCGSLATELVARGLTGVYNHDTPIINGVGKNPKKRTGGIKQDAALWSRVQTCTKGDWGIEYNYQLTSMAKKNGMACGDCVSFVKALYTKCFDKRIKGANADGRTKPNIFPTTRFRATREEFRKDIPGFLSKLKFGDIIAMVGPPGHTVMYTGGRADVPFEIMEMGGGGEGDLKSKALAKKNSGTKLEPAGVRLATSALNYFQIQTLKFETMHAFGVIDQSP